MRIPILLAAAIAVVATHSGPARAETERTLGDLGQVGAVEFPTSCDPAVQEEFERGVALLHSFFYQEARRVFEGIARKDPECAMAHWGVAMSYYHPIWAAPDSAELAAGSAAAKRALAAKKQGERERAYILSIDAYYEGEDSPDAHLSNAAPSCHGAMAADNGGRAACFSRGMRDVMVRYEDDVDAAAFYALSLLATAPPADPLLANQMQAAAILEERYAERQHHPGLAHYLIHSYDYPPTAKKGLAAAEAYAGIAPWVPHALHMPSHIFTRLGMWDETIESNLASAEAARAYEAEHHPGAASSEELHALDYLMYGYLQTAQDEKARALLDRLAAIERTEPVKDFAISFAAGAMPARYALERRQWKEAASLTPRSAGNVVLMPTAEGSLVYARAVGAARLGDAEEAAAAASRLGELAAGLEGSRFQYFAEQMKTQQAAAAALTEFAEGNRESAIAKLRLLAAREDSLGKSPVSPGAILPVRELLADALLESGQAKAALAEYEASLVIYPGRFAAIYGAAHAAEAAGLGPQAKVRYEELLSLAKGAAGRQELTEAQRYLAASH